MPRILWLCALIWLLACVQNTLQGQETWQIQHLLDNDDYVMGVTQSHDHAYAPRDNRALALSPDYQFLYLGYNNPPSRRLVRKISLHVSDPANNTLAVVAQLALPTASAPAKAIATDDRGRVYLARGGVIEIYDADLSARLYTLTGFEQCEGVAVARAQGKLVLYASDRKAGTLSRFEMTEGAGEAVQHVMAAGLEGQGKVRIANSAGLRGLAVQSNGVVWLADREAHRVFRVEPEGKVYGAAVRCALDLALDEKRGEVFVTQDTLRTITVLRLPDGVPLRAITPPFAALGLIDDRAEIALSGIDAIPGKRLFVSNEAGHSQISPMTGDSPFSNNDDANIVFDDDDDPVLTMRFSFIAEAGVDREIALGQAVTLGGNPTVAGGQAPFRYRWAPLLGLNDNTLSNPIAQPSRTTTYHLLVTDKTGAVAHDQVTLTVPSYVFLARNFVYFGGNENSAGNIYCNGPITFGPGLPGVHRGDLIAGGDVVVHEHNLIVGNVKTRGKLSLRGEARVEGLKHERVEVLEVPLPRVSFRAGGASFTIAEESALPPGSYGKVRLAPNAVLHLQNGEYYFERFTAQNAARLVFENAAAPTFLYVAGALSFGENVKVHLAQTEGASTTQVHFNVLEKGDLEIGKGAVVLGNLLAPEAHVQFAPGSRLLGSVTADAITVAKNVSFHVHPASTQELLELMPIYFAQEEAKPEAQTQPRRARPQRDTIAIAPPPIVAPIDTMAQDPASPHIEPDTAIIKPQPARGNNWAPVAAGALLLALLLLLLFLLLRRKREPEPKDYWQVKHTRRAAKKRVRFFKPKETKKGHWRIRSRR
jgi:cytoskeletal protein CcmA (bactofilin family)